MKVEESDLVGIYVKTYYLILKLLICHAILQTKYADSHYTLQ